MRHFARHLFTLCSIMSLMLCVAVCLLWVRSRHHVDQLDHVALSNDPRERVDWSFTSVIGRVSAVRTAVTPIEGTVVEEVPTFASPAEGWSLTTRPVLINPRQAQASLLLRLGFNLRVVQPTPTPDRRLLGRGVSAMLPHWALVALLATLPAIWLLLRRCRAKRARQRAEGRCPSCGYDLRASWERCPECGTVAPASSVSKPSAMV